MMSLTVERANLEYLVRPLVHKQTKHFGRLWNTWRILVVTSCDMSIIYHMICQMTHQLLRLGGHLCQE